MSTEDSVVPQLTDAVKSLQDAIRKASFDQQAVRADVVHAANILLGILGLEGVAPDIGGGQ